MYFGLEEIIKGMLDNCNSSRKDRKYKDKLQSLALIKDTYNNENGFID